MCSSSLSSRVARHWSSLCINVGTLMDVRVLRAAREMAAGEALKYVRCAL